MAGEFCVCVCAFVCLRVSFLPRFQKKHLPSWRAFRFGGVNELNPWLADPCGITLLAER